MRKVRYPFSDLSNEPQIDADNQARRYFAMSELCQYQNIIDTFESVASVSSMLVEDYYYVATDFVRYKGKKISFRGELLIAGNMELIAYLGNAAASDDLCQMLISPLFGVKPERVIVITEDFCYLYSRGREGM